MADPTVKISFIGDAKDLSKSIGAVDKQLAGVSSDLDKHSSKMSGAFSKMGKDAEHGFRGVRDSADDGERRITGFRDSLTGTQDVMKGLREGDMVALSTGFADLASSVANLGADMLDWGKKAFEGAKSVVEAHAASVVAKTKDIASMVAHKVATIASTIATQAQAVAQWALNAAMSANPIVLVVAAIAALTAGVILAYKNFDWFRDAVDGAWQMIQSMFGWIKEHWEKILVILTGPFGLAVVAIVRNFDTIKETFGKVVGFFEEVGGKLKSAIVWPFEQAFNFVRGVYDKSIGPMISAIEGIAGFGKGAIDVNAETIKAMRARGATDEQIKAHLGDKIGEIGTFAKGGIVGGVGPIGSPQLIVAHKGEEFLGINGQRGGAHNTYNITVQSLDPRTAESLVIAAITGYENANGFVPIRRIMHRNAN